METASDTTSIQTQRPRRRVFHIWQVRQHMMLVATEAIPAGAEVCARLPSNDEYPIIP